MFPELFSVGPFTVYSYGLMTALGIIAAIWIGENEIKRAQLAPDGFLMGMGIACVVGGYAASKLLFWITILPEIIKEPARLLDLSSGFVVYGGLIGGIVTAYFYCKIKKVDFWSVFDLATPAVALAQCLGRVGCFLAGCCYGNPTESALGVVFHRSLYAPNNIKLFPVQLMASGLNLLNFAVLYFLWRKGRMKKGMVGSLYIINYSVGRFFLEYFRGDLERGNIGTLSTSQFISIFTLGIGLLLLFVTYQSKIREEQ